MPEYEHKECSIGFRPKRPETDEEMRHLLRAASSMPGVRIEFDNETCQRFKAVIEEFEREQDEKRAANAHLFEKKLYADA